MWPLHCAHCCVNLAVCMPLVHTWIGWPFVIGGSLTYMNILNIPFHCRTQNPRFGFSWFLRAISATLQTSDPSAGKKPPKTLPLGRENTACKAEECVWWSNPQPSVVAEFYYPYSLWASIITKGTEKGPGGPTFINHGNDSSILSMICFFYFSFLSNIILDFPWSHHTLYVTQNTPQSIIPTVFYSINFFCTFY